jgi:hypothetical protein
MRYYDADIGRYVTRDPAGYRGGLDVRGGENRAFSGRSELRGTTSEPRDRAVPFGSAGMVLEPARRERGWRTGARTANGDASERTPFAQGARHGPARESRPNAYVYGANNPVSNIDPLGLAWYKPWSWDWRKISSGFTGRAGLGVGLGVDVNVPLVGVRVKVGGSAKVMGNFNPVDENFVSGEHDIGIKVGAWGHAIGLDYEYYADTEKTESESGSVLGYGYVGEYGGDPKTLGLEVDLVVVSLGFKVDLGDIWGGIVGEEGQQEAPIQPDQ